MPDQDLLDVAEQRLVDWDRRAKLWWTLYYVLGLLSVFLTITVASRPHFVPKDPDWFATIAWLAALFEGFCTFAVALPKAAAYRSAWRLLWLARVEYLDDKQSANAAKLLKETIAKGW